MKIWNFVARTILSNRIVTLLILACITLFLAFQSKNVQFSYDEANLLPKDNPANIEYDNFLKIFGEEGNIMVIGVKDQSVFKDVKKFNNWLKLANQISADRKIIDGVISLGNIKELVKDDAHQKFKLKAVFKQKIYTQKELDSIKNHLFNNVPFYDNLLFNKKTGTIQTIIYINKKIVNTKARSLWIKEVFNPMIAKFNKDNNLQVRVSGMPYVRSMNASSVKSEMGMFLGLGLAITCGIFFIFFRSFRATLITLSVVVISVVWSFGTMGFFDCRISILTALIPPLLIVIGVPNCIFLIQNYQQEVLKHGNQAKSLYRVIVRIGNAIFLNNLTTSIGFATFIFTKSTLLKDFGFISSLNIMATFVLCICYIPILYSYMPLPPEKHLKHIENKGSGLIIGNIINILRNHRPKVYVGIVAVIIFAIIGSYKIKVSGSLIEDMSKKTQFYKDIVFFEKEFGGILPLEIVIDTKREKGVMKLATLKRIEALENEIEKIPELSKPVSVNSLVKYSKQAFYNGHKDFYELPTSQEKDFILAYAQNSGAKTNALNTMVDKTGRYARITTFMKDVGTEDMNRIQERLNVVIQDKFPAERFKVTITGKALVFVKGTNYLIENLVLTMILAIFLIGLLIGSLFKSFQMIVIATIPNLIPLLLTSGLMGYFGIPLKPSTILVFSIAFGISVDNTIFFLSKYRHELMTNGFKIKKALYTAVRECAMSMFYTSIVLFFGFLIFIVSSFGGTKALGGLISVTLLISMLLNLIFLPTMIITFQRKIKHKKLN